MTDIDKKREEIRGGIQDLMDTCWEKCNPDYPKLITFRPMKFLNELVFVEPLIGKDADILV